MQPAWIRSGTQGVIPVTPAYDVEAVPFSSRDRNPRRNIAKRIDLFRHRAHRHARHNRRVIQLLCVARIDRAKNLRQTVKRAIVVEYGLKVRTEKAHGVQRYCTTS